jgi:hypothetical protein
MTVPGLESFVQKQLNFPLKMITNLHALEAEKLGTNLSSVFYLQFQDSLDSRVEVLKRAAQLVRLYDCVPVGPRSNATKLVVFKSRTVSVEYNGNWSLDSVSEFVYSNAFCLLSPLTSRVVDEFAAKRGFIVVVFILHDMYEPIAALMVALRPRFAVFYEIYNPVSPMTTMLGIQEDQLPQLCLIDPNTSRHSLIDLNDTADLQGWMDNFEIGQIKWNGEGVRVISEFMAKLKMMYANGGWPLYVIAFCLAFIIGAVTFMAWDCYRMFRLDHISKRE